MTLTIERQFGMYRIKRGAEILGGGLTLEKALIAAAHRVGITIAGEGELSVRSTFEMALVLEGFLGPEKPESELVNTENR